MFFKWCWKMGLFNHAKVLRFYQDHSRKETVFSKREDYPYRTRCFRCDFEIAGFSYTPENKSIDITLFDNNASISATIEGILSQDESITILNNLKSSKDAKKEITLLGYYNPDLQKFSIVRIRYSGTTHTPIPWEKKIDQY